MDFCFLSLFVCLLFFPCIIIALDNPFIFFVLCISLSPLSLSLSLSLFVYIYLYLPFSFSCIFIT